MLQRALNSRGAPLASVLLVWASGCYGAAPSTAGQGGDIDAAVTPSMAPDGDGLDGREDDGRADPDEGPGDRFGEGDTVDPGTDPDPDPEPRAEDPEPTCADGEAVFYADCDRDGFAALGAERATLCGSNPQPVPTAAPADCPDGGWTAEAPTEQADCADRDPRAFPWQTQYFDTPVEGVPDSYDFDCDGAETLVWERLRYADYVALREARGEEITCSHEQWNRRQLIVSDNRNFETRWNSTAAPYVCLESREEFGTACGTSLPVHIGPSDIVLCTSRVHRIVNGWCVTGITGGPDGNEGPIPCR